MSITTPPRWVYPEDDDDHQDRPPPGPPEYAKVKAHIGNLAKKAMDRIPQAIEASGHERAKLLQLRARLQADAERAGEVRAERRAVHARANVADRAITGAPHGNRRRRIPTLLYAGLIAVLFALNIPLDMAGLFALQIPLVYTLLLAGLGGFIILGAGHVIGHHLKRASHCVDPKLQLPASERRFAFALGITVSAVIVVLAVLRGLNTGWLGGLFVLAALGAEFGLAILLAYHHEHGGERERRQADSRAARHDRAHRISIREAESQRQRFLRSRTQVAGVAAGFVARYEVLETVAANNWLINHPDQDQPPPLPTPEWVHDARALARGAIPTQLLLPEEAAAPSSEGDGNRP